MSENTVGERTLELVRNLDAGIYEEAEAKGITVSQLMEREDPTSEAPKHLRGTDAFQRALIAMDIRTRADMATGYPASTLGDLYEADGKRGAVLVPEFIMRTVRVAEMFGTQISRMRDPFGTYRRMFGGERFYESSNPVSDVLRPDYLDTYIHAEPLTTSLLPKMVALDESVADGRPYQGFYLTYTAAKSRLHRITEGAPPVQYELTGSDRTFYMTEFGFEINFSYATAREWALPVFQQHLAYIVGQNDLDKEQVAYETIINGDGTAAAATNTNLSALTAAHAAGSYDIETGDLLEWLRLFEGNGNYNPTIAIGTSAVCHYVDMSDFGSANHPTWFTINAAMPGEGARPERRTFPPLYARSYATANKLLAWDATKSLRMRHTIKLTETDKVISNRMNKIVVSEFTGFSILVDGGRRTLDVAN